MEEEAAAAAAAVGYGSTLFTMPGGVARPGQPPCSPLTPPASATVRDQKRKKLAVTTGPGPGASALMSPPQCEGTQLCVES